MNRFLIVLAAIAIALSAVSYSHANVQATQQVAVACVPQQQVLVQAVPLVQQQALVTATARLGLFDRLRLNRAYRKSVRETKVQVATVAPVTVQSVGACVGVSR